jgi:alkanesulfonate monooxygenase SsuD/methylene tetrahydromethanopterin reductase-like flavin-dependent oxidoreductase (luciferase family)
MGAIADGWIPTWVTADGYREYVPRICDSLERHGRLDTRFTIAKECYAAIATDGGEARRFSRPTFDTFTKGFTVSTYEGAIASALLGSTDEVVEQLNGYAEAGVQHVEMKFVYLSIDHLHEQMRQFAEEIIPQVNG